MDEYFALKNKIKIEKIIRQLAFRLVRPKCKTRAKAHRRWGVMSGTPGDPVGPSGNLWELQTFFVHVTKKKKIGSPCAATKYGPEQKA